MSRHKRRRALGLVALVAAAALLPEAAVSGSTTASPEFNTLVTKLTEWATGGLGEAISLAAVIVGAMVSVIRSNPMPILSGIAFAMILNFTPGIVTTLLTATL